MIEMITLSYFLIIKDNSEKLKKKDNLIFNLITITCFCIKLVSSDFKLYFTLSSNDFTIYFNIMILTEKY